MGVKASTLKRIRDLAISDVLAAEGAPLKRIGREAVSICPWHNDTNPSLTVSDDKNLCFCFACGGGSDAIAYIQQKFNLSFSDAVERIAAKHGFEVEYDNIDPEEALRVAQQRRELFLQLQTQQESFRSGLKSDLGLAARQWLISREITPESSREFGLGYSSSGYFSSRVTVPIHDHRGNLVGFTGRDVSGDKETQKYKNSASSEIFNKGALVFNEHRIADAVRLSSKLIFVEGHFDVISMWQHGIKNVVAVQGTAPPTLESLKRLSRHCRNFVLCYDGDQGGLKAIDNFMTASLDLVMSGELNVSIAELPEGKDPDECLRGSIDLAGIIENSKQWIEWKVDRLTGCLDFTDTRQIAQAESQIKGLIDKIKSHALRQYYIDKAAKALSQTEKSAAKLAAEWSSNAQRHRTVQSWIKPDLDWSRYQAEKRILRAYIHFPETRNRLEHLMPRLNSGQHVWLWNRIKELIGLGGEINADSLKIVLAVSEPDYIRSIRPMLMPTIKLHCSDGILDHAERVLTQSDEPVN
jgi:DNA primase